MNRIITAALLLPLLAASAHAQLINDPTGIRPMVAPKGNAADLSGYNFGAFAELWDALVHPIDLAVYGMATALAGPVAHTLANITLLAVMIALLAGVLRLNMSIGDVFVQLLRTAVIYTVLTRNGTLQMLLNEMLVTTPNQLMAWTAGQLGNAPVTSGGAMFDGLVTKIVSVGQEVLNRFPDEWSLKFTVAAVCVALYWVLALAAMLPIFITALVLHVSLALLAAIAPLAIACAVVPVTRAWFFAWCGTVAAVILATVLVTAMLGIVLTLLGVALGRVHTAPAGGNLLAQVGGLFGIAASIAVCAYVVKNIPSMSAAICRGAYTHATAVGQAAFVSGAQFIGGVVAGGGGRAPAPALTAPAAVAGGGGVGSRAWQAANHSAGRVQGYQP